MKICNKCGAEAAEEAVFCQYCGRKLPRTDIVEGKKRHGFVSFYLVFGVVGLVWWLGMISYLSIFSREWINYYSPYLLPYYEYYNFNSFFLGLNALISLVSGVGYILILNWKKIGFWICVGASAVGAISTAISQNIIAAICGCFGIVIVWAILQLKKDGVSAWSNLE
jgi:ribosomal protein L40E